MKREVVIASAARTPIGKFLGGISTLAAPELGAIAIREAVNRSGIELNQVDEVIMGNVCPAGIGQAPARQAAIKAGIPAEVGSTTINKVCASGLKAVVFAAQAIQADDADIIIADEPVSNLDPELAEDALQLLVECAKRRGVTLVVNLHQPELARQFATRFIGLFDGRVVFDGPPEGFTEKEAKLLYNGNGNGRGIHPSGRIDDEQSKEELAKKDNQTRLHLLSR